MLIEDISRAFEGEYQVWSANVVWEDVCRENRRIYIRLPGSYKISSSNATAGFLLCCSLFAWNHSEKRIFVDGELDPWLVINLSKAICYLNYWYGVDTQLNIESVGSTNSGHNEESDLHNPRRGDSALFFSGGLDSICSLVRNRQQLPMDHKLSVKQCIMVQGLDIDYDESRTGGQQEALKKCSFQAVKKVCEATGATPVEISTNIRSLDIDSNFYADKAHGAILAGLAQFLSQSVSEVYIASTSDISTLSPWGSHPLLDVNYSSTGVRIHHDSEDLSRLEKLRITSSDSIALGNLRVCSKAYQVPEGYINCGKCRKCILAMLGYLVLDLDFAECFPKVDSMANNIRDNLGAISREFQAKQIEELIGPLQDIGREDLVAECNIALRRWHQYVDWKNGENFNGLLRRLWIKLTNAKHRHEVA